MAKKIVEKLFNAFMSVVFSIIQVICLPLNALFENVFPDFSSWITKVSTTLNSALSNLSFAFSIFPPAVRTLLGIILPTELALLVIFRSTHLTSKAWTILQKLKFW